MQPSKLEYLKHCSFGTPVENLALIYRSLRDRGRVLQDRNMRAVLLDEPAAIVSVLSRAIAADTNCVDAGAHLGAMTSQFVRRAPKGQHISVEPTPYKARWLRRSYPTVTVIEAALAAHSGSAEFFHQPRASGYSGLRRHTGGMEKLGEAVRFHVWMTTLDEIVPVERRIGFLKVDTEGAELGVFLGAQRILRRDRPTILFECTQTGTQAFQSTPGELFDRLVEEDYDLRTPQGFVGRTAPLSREQFVDCTLYPFKSFNFVATPNS